MSRRTKIVKLYLRRKWLAKLPDKDLDALRKPDRPTPPSWVVRPSRWQEESIAGVRCVWIDRHHADRGVIVYLHGGAYIFGPVREQWAWLAMMARKTGMAALMVDYRLAPEHPFPAGLDDATAVVRQLQKDGALPDDHWALAGDSAGGGLSVALTMRLRDEGDPLPPRLLLISPWLDVTMDNPDAQAIVPHDPFLWLEGTKLAGQVYAWESNPRQPLVSPVYGEMEGLPPVLLQCGTAEILLPDIRRFHEKCQLAGVEIEYQEADDSFHVFVMAPFLPEAKRAVRTQIAFLTQPERQPR